MTTLAGINISKVLFNTLGPGSLKATLTKRTASPGALVTDGPVYISMPYPCVVYVTGKVYAPKGEDVYRREQEIRVFKNSLPEGIEPGAGDQLTVNGLTYHLISINNVTTDTFFIVTCAR